MLQHAKYYEDDYKNTISIDMAHISNIVDTFGPIVFVCIPNQFKGHWLLSDALNSAISMSLKFKDEIDFATFDNLMEENANVVFEL